MESLKNYLFLGKADWQGRDISKELNGLVTSFESVLRWINVSLVRKVAGNVNYKRRCSSGSFHYLM
jgi:hypothetical protein